MVPKALELAGNRVTIHRLPNRQLSHYTDCAIHTLTCSKHNKTGAVLRDTEAYMCNHFCGGKEVGITYSECVASLR